MKQILEDGFRQQGLSFSDSQAGLFEAYYKHLDERNSVMNLTAITGEEDTARLHFLDCAALASLYDFSGASVIDVGSGAGFPGLPLKLAVPNINLTLLDSHKKRVDFLQECVDLLELSDTRCLCGRAEELAPDIGGSFDVAVSRAVAKLNILCELCLPFVHVGGVFIAMKGPDCREELQQSMKALALLGGRDPVIRSYTIPGTDIVHSAVIIKKVKPTPPQYPRQFGKIKKSPL